MGGGFDGLEWVSLVAGGVVVLELPLPLRPGQKVPHLGARGALELDPGQRRKIVWKKEVRNEKRTERQKIRNGSMPSIKTLWPKLNWAI